VPCSRGTRLDRHILGTAPTGRTGTGHSPGHQMG
jgi:hypothetical protein